MKTSFPTIIIAALTIWWTLSTRGGDTLSKAQIEKIGEAARTSKFKHHVWKNYDGSGGGTMISEYVHGMGVMYAQYSVMLGNESDDEVLKAITSPVGENEADAVWKYRKVFAKLGLDVTSNRQDTLRALFLVLFELGERESDGGYTIGYDLGGNKPGKEKELLRKYLKDPNNLTRAEKVTVAETSEAGLFQASWNFRNSEPLCTKLLGEYKTESGRSSTFSFTSHFIGAGKFYGVGSKDKEAVGIEQGLTFQQLAKDKPAFAVEYTALTLRTKGNLYYHYLLQDKMELGSRSGKTVGQKGLDFMNKIEGITAEPELPLPSKAWQIHTGN